jgi:sugar phosphate isomerase/epimerase
LSLAAADLDLLAAIEVLNQFEQSKAPMDIFNLTANVIDEATINGRVGLHYDTVHAFMRMGHEEMINFYRKHKSKIFVLELANKDRLPFDQDCGIDFAAHISEIQDLRPSVRLGAEAFCTTVVQELRLDFYNTPFLGRVARARNAAYLKERGWM